jgi:hypothetical protein
VRLVRDAGRAVDGLADPCLRDGDLERRVEVGVGVGARGRRERRLRRDPRRRRVARERASSCWMI